MTSGADLVRAAETFLGEPYSVAPGRTSPTSGYKDCSGLIAAAYEVATGQELGAYVSVTIYDLAAKNGLTISLDEALGIAGACLLIPTDPYQGWGPNGHIGFSTGDGHTIEATPAYRGGVQRLRADQQGWGPNACLLPGIDYSNGGHGTPTTQEDRMRPGLFLDAPTGRVYVYDPNNHTKTWLRTPEALAMWQGLAVLNGNNADIHENEATRILLADAADLRASGVTVPGDCPPGLADATLEDLLAEVCRRRNP